MYYEKNKFNEKSRIISRRKVSKKTNNILKNDFSCFINYDINDFEYNHNPFYIKIGNNYFSKKKIHIDIEDKELNISIYGELKYSESININTSTFSPKLS